MQFAVPVLAADLSLTTLLPRLFLSMAVVIGVMWLAARIMRNRQVPGSGVLRSSSQKNAPALQIIAKQGLGGKSSIAIIRAGDKSLVLGLTESTVSLLAELDTVELGNSLTTSPTPAKATTRFGDRTYKQSESHGTGTPRMTATAASNSTRKGLLEQVREMTVRK